jgi:hypothetical protein
MTRLSSQILLNPGDLASNFASIADAGNVSLGATAYDNAGCAYRFCQAGAVALVPGKLQQASAQIANHQNMAVTTAVAGATSVTVALGATAVTANQYAGGWLVITTSTGAGYRYLISSHPAAALSTSLVLTLSDALATATVTATTKGDLIANPFSGVIVNPAAASSCPVGVASLSAITATYFGWIQSHGVCNVLADGAITVGTQLVASNGTDGAVEPFAGVQAIVGQAVTDIDTTQYGAVRLFL